nr:hypothetical protein [uncultured Roseibium sp.]
MGVYQTKAQVHAFERGFQAYGKGKSQADNPYPREADYFTLWTQGFQEAQKQDSDTEHRA